MTKVVLVHDYLTQRGGAERVVLSMSRTFPGAPIYTSLYSPRRTWPEFSQAEIYASCLNHVAPLRNRHRLALPLLARTFSGMSIDAEVALCSSSGWAHGARVTGRKVVYCHAPARWVYQTDRYVDGAAVPVKVLIKMLAPHLRRWDLRAAGTADRYLVNSTVVRDLVQEVYGVCADVVHPPVLVRDGPTRDPLGIEPGFFMVVGRVMTYKNMDRVAAAFAHLPGQRLVVVGDGPQMGAVRAVAGPNVHLLGRVEDDVLQWCYDHTSGLVAASFEDFGLTPIEAAARGCPTVALHAGGYLDTVVEGVTGVFFDSPEPEQIARAVTVASQTRWHSDEIRAHGATFGEPAFSAKLRQVINETAD